jgi:hypothetical protein
MYRTARWHFRLAFHVLLPSPSGDWEALDGVSNFSVFSLRPCEGCHTTLHGFTWRTLVVCFVVSVCLWLL